MLQLSFVKFSKDSYILVEGRPATDRFYIIQTGKVVCTKSISFQTGEETYTLGPGDFIGVIPCMSGRPQIETVIALTDVVAISVRRDQYPELIEKNTPVAMKIIRTFANKMRNMNDVLTKITLKSNIISSPEQLFNIAAYYEKVGKTDLAIYGYYQYMKSCPHGVYLQHAKQRFVILKPTSKAVYFEPPKEPIRYYPKGTMIFSECQSGSDMFIIQEGQVSISKVVDGNEVVLAVLKKGDFFGEMALLENKPRSASAIAHEDCRLMTVNRKNFDQMVTTQPQLISRLTTTFAERLWAIYRQLENTQIREPVAKLLDMLALQLEKTKISVTPGVSWQFDLTPMDLLNMCGVSQFEQGAFLDAFIHDSRIKLNNNKIYVKDCDELLKFSAFVRKPKR